MYKNSDREYAIELSPSGYAYQYNRGNSVSVASDRFNRHYGQQNMLIHNHPSGGHFSDADLLNTANIQLNRGGIVAVGNKYTYTFRKNGGKFKSEAFTKAVKKARMKGKSYDDAVDKWLKANQKTYGYTYTKTRTK